MTTKSWSLEDCARYYPEAGIKGITVWRQHLQGYVPEKAQSLLQDSGLEIVSLCRGGFFPSISPDTRQESLDDNLRAIEEAHQLGAPVLVLVCGADPNQSLETNRAQITDSIHRLLPDAQAAGVTLAIEPLHPMYAGDRSAINTMAQAHQVCDLLGSPSHLGIAIDVYHLWWDDQLKSQIKLAGEKNRIAAFHVCDWKTPTLDLLNDRGLMGEGCIPIREIQSWVNAAGFTGFNEVEIFSDLHWAKDPHQWLQEITHAFQQHVA